MNCSIIIKDFKITELVIMDGIALKKVKFDDLIELHEIQERLFGEDAILWSWWNDLLQDNYCFLKLERKYPNNELIGAIAILESRNNIAYIYVLFVKPAYQRKGYGTWAVSKVIENLKKDHFKGIFLHTKVINKAVVSFYELIGFKIINTIREYYRSGDDAHVMELIF